MKSASRAILWVSLGLALWALITPAQDQDSPAGTPDTSKPYAKPSAPKSVEIANFYLKKKKYNAALSRYQEAVKTDPYYPPGYLGLGRVYEKIGLKQKALEAYQKYLDALPSTKEAEDAKQVHQAMARLEHDLKIRKKPRKYPSFPPAPN